MPNDKIEEITHALEIGEKFDEHYAVHNSQVRYLLQLVDHQQAEIERKDKFVAEWISGEDKFNEFGGWERIERMQHEVERLKEEYADERQSHNEHVTEMLETEQDLLRTRAALQQSREENERLRNKLQYIDGQRMDAESENERLRGELESHESWKAISEAVQRELEQIKAERDDYRKVLEWYGDGSEDGGEKARDVILRYKRGDGADGDVSQAPSDMG